MSDKKTRLQAFLLKASLTDTEEDIKEIFGYEGHYFYIHLLRKLCEAHGHALDLRKENDLGRFSRRGNVSVDEAEKILNYLSKCGKIDQALWQCKIVWYRPFVEKVLIDGYRKSAHQKPCSRDEIITSFDLNIAKIDKISVLLNSKHNMKQHETGCYMLQQPAATCNNMSPKERKKERKNKNNPVPSAPGLYTGPIINYKKPTDHVDTVHENSSVAITKARPDIEDPNERSVGFIKKYLGQFSFNNTDELRDCLELLKIETLDFSDLGKTTWIRLCDGYVKYRVNSSKPGDEVNNETAMRKWALNELQAGSGLITPNEVATKALVYFRDKNKIYLDKTASIYEEIESRREKEDFDLADVIFRSLPKKKRNELKFQGESQLEREFPKLMKGTTVHDKILKSLTLEFVMCTPEFYSKKEIPYIIKK